MSRYLFLGLEDGEETSAIDRVLDKSGAGEDKPLSLSAQILAKREAMVKEAQEEAAKLEDEEESDSDDSDSDDGDSDEGGDGDGDSDGEGGDDDDWGDDGDGEEGGDGDSGDDDDDDWDDDDSDDDDSDSDEADDDSDDKKDDSKDEDKDDDKEDKDKDDDKKSEQEKLEESWESHVDKNIRRAGFEDIKSNIRLPKGWNIFKALRKAERQRRDFLLGMGFGMEDGESGPELNKEELGDVNDSNIAFTKDAIVEAISNLGEINKKYYDNTEIYLDKLMKSIPKLDERLMNFQRVYERGDVDFTNKTISDASILAHIAYDKEFKLREVMNRIKQYTKDSNDIAKLILNSPFKDLENAFLSKEYLSKGEVLEYKRKLPGFNIAAVSLPEFTNYLKTSPLEYQYYTLKENNPSEMYEINPVSITEEKDVEFFLDNLKATIIELAVSVDILRALLVEFKKFMNELKILRVGVEEDEYEKLSELGLDEKVQQFILFKLVVEIISVNINISVETVSGVMEVMDQSLKLTEIEPEVESNSDSDSGGSDDWGSDDSDDEEDNDSDDGDSDDGDDDDFDDEDW